jgi:hypothetical protein
VIKIDISIASVAQVADHGAAFHHPSFLSPPLPGDGHAPFINPSVNPYTGTPHPYPPPVHLSNNSSAAYQYPTQSPFANFVPSNPPMQSSGVCHQGVSTRDFVLRLCAMNPSIIPLVLVMKQFLQVTSTSQISISVMSRKKVFMTLSPEVFPHTLSPL